MKASERKFLEIKMKLAQQRARKRTLLDYLFLRFLDVEWDPKDWGELVMLRWMEACGLHEGMELKPTEPKNAKDNTNKNTPPFRQL